MKISVTDFFKPIEFSGDFSERITPKIESFIQFAKAISQMTYQSIYIVDYFKRGFIYVSDNPLFLCGTHSDQVLKEGYLFYFRNVPQKDLEMLLKINEAGFSFFKNLPREDRLKYTISYDFHLKQSKGISYTKSAE